MRNNLNLMAFFCFFFFSRTTSAEGSARPLSLHFTVKLWISVSLLIPHGYSVVLKTDLQ